MAERKAVNMAACSVELMVAIKVDCWVVWMVAVTVEMMDLHMVVETVVVMAEMSDSEKWH